MKTLLKKFNIGSLIILLVAGVVMTTQSAFKSSQVLNTYYYDSVSNEWRPLIRVYDDTVDGEGNYLENSYQCTSASTYCTGEFDSSAPVIDGEEEPSGDFSLGLYTENPEPQQ